MKNVYLFFCKSNRLRCFLSFYIIFIYFTLMYFYWENKEILTKIKIALSVILPIESKQKNWIVLGKIDIT